MIVDDDAIVRDGIFSLLKTHPKINVCAQASSGEEACHLTPNHEPDVILMDISMPGFGGVEATKRILLSYPDIKVLALSAHCNDNAPSEILNVGASGYLTKGVNFNEMCEAIERVYQGEQYVCSAVSDKIKSNMNLGRDLIMNNLSKLETTICKEIIYGRSIAEIAKQLGMSTSEIEKIKQDLYTALDIENDIALMHLAIRNGYLDKTNQQNN